MSIMDGPTRVTVFLTPETMVELESAAVFAGESRTDAINRAIQVYAALVRIKRDAGRLLVRDRDGHTDELIIE